MVDDAKYGNVFPEPAPNHAAQQNDGNLQAPQLSVPKGGGAIRGIGEKFTNNAVTGTGSMTVPIAVSPGRNGFSPQLALSYNSGSSNGPFGIGGSVANPSISRKTDKGLPRYLDDFESDVFILSGSEDLVPELTADGVRRVDDDSVPGFAVHRYRPRIEGLFARIERWTHRASGEIHWRSISRDNVTTFYGVDDNSRIFDPDDAVAERPKRVFSWLISSSFDDKGNAIVYEYAAENGANVDIDSPSEAHRFRIANRYLKRIFYGNRTPLYPAGQIYGPCAADSAWMFEVDFDYGEGHYTELENDGAGNGLVRASSSCPEPANWPVRHDPFSSYRSGFEIRTYRLCRRVLVFHHFPEELDVEEYLVRSTEFTYLETKVASYLQSVIISGYILDSSGHHRYRKQSLPPLEFEFTQVPDAQQIAQRQVQFVDAQSLENLPVGIDGSTYEWLDLDGEGAAGILSEQNEAWFYKRNLSPKSTRRDDGSSQPEPRFGAAELVPEKPAGLVSRGARFLDLRGDARQSLVETQGPLHGFYGRGEEREWLPFRPFASWPEVDTRDPNLRFVDLTGDGRADILITEGQVFTWYPSLAEAGFGPGERVSPPWQEERAIRLVFENDNESIYLADLSGDGLSDLVRIRNGEVCYWPNLGYGRFGRKITMEHSPRFDLPDQFDQKGIVLADVDGSGTTDILYRGRDGLRLYLNQAGNGWSAPIAIPQFPASDAQTTINAVDLLGNGTVCIVWSSPSTGIASPMRYIALMDDKPHLLVRTVNNLGAETRIRYAPSTRFYLKDEQSGRPWATRLPFPVQVVDSVEVVDHISRTRFTSQYTYHHGYYDAREREFRGFGMVEQTDTEAYEEYIAGVEEIGGGQERNRESYQPPVTTLSWFHLGAFELNDKLAHHYRDEYFRCEQTLPASVLPANADVRDVPECLRALKGQLLRQEIYSFDGSALEQNPYQITEFNYDVRLLQPVSFHQHAVTFPVPRSSVSLQMERNPGDPRISQDFNLEVDDFGNVRKSCSIIFGRATTDLSLPPEVQCEQERRYISYSEKDYTANIDRASAYRIGVPYHVRAYEITGLPPTSGLFDPEELRMGIARAAEIPYEAIADEYCVQKRLLSRNLTLFLSDDFKPLPAGQWDSLALRYQSYQLAFTPGIIREYYGDKVADNDFERAFYVHIDDDRHWWIPSAIAVYGENPAARFYIPRGFRDPSGVENDVTLDRYHLLPVHVTVKQAAWKSTSAVNDYRLLGPVLVTDLNGNRTASFADALGMVVRFAVMGKAGTSEGDTLDDPTTRVEYSMWEWMRFLKPNFAHSYAREVHGPSNTRWQESYSYSNGSGAVVMLKAQAPPGKAIRCGAHGEIEEHHANPRWVGNGRTVLNNKGNPIKQYEPYFSATHEYESEQEVGAIGVTPIFSYDAPGRNVRTDFPNGTFTRVEFDPWKSRSFDANDTVKESEWYRERGSPDPGAEPEPSDPERRAAWLAAMHADTPSVAHFDSLGRTIARISDYGHGKTALVRSENDLTGRHSRTFDQLGREVMSGFTAMAGIPIYSETAEKGRRWSFHTALGELYKSWDENGREFSAEYDVIRRPVSVKVREANNPEITFNYIVYGDRLPNPTERNLLGVAYLTFDQGGLLRTEELDFKSTPVRVATVLAQDYKHSIDWSDLANETDLAALEARASRTLEADTPFIVRSEYDALDRPTKVSLPDGSVFVPRYDEANMLTSLKAQIRGHGEFVEFLKGQEFDAKGQKQWTHLGNDVISRYFYDPRTFRLERLFTGSPSSDGQSDALQDLRYTFDPVGNVVEVRDRAQQTRYFARSVVRPGHLYRYNSMYQLTHAIGREHANRVNDAERTESESEFVPQLPHENDDVSLRTYREEYEYDLMGNMLELRHRYQARNGVGGGWTERFRYAYQEDPANCTNRLIASSMPGDELSGPFHARYTYDHQGNMLRMAHLEQMSWNFLDRLVRVDLGGGGEAFYVYDNSGQRLRKVIERPGGLRTERIYLGAVEIFRKRQGDAQPFFERYTLHVADGGERIAQIDTKTIDTEDAEPANPAGVPLIRYQHTDHLGSTALETDVDSEVVSYEEFHPYGTSAYRSFKSRAEFSLKRYRYCGREHDDETGFYYFGERYYAPWIARWTSADPGGFADTLNLFQYCHCNPIGMHDLSGLEGSRVYQLGPEFDKDIHTNTPEAKARLEGALSGRQVEENGVLYQINHAVVEWRGGQIGWFFNTRASDISIVDSEQITFEPDVIEGKPGGAQTDTPPDEKQGGDGGQPDGSPDGTSDGTQTGQQGAGGKGETGAGEGGGGSSDDDDDSFFTSSFFKGLAVGLVVTVAVVAVVATGGAALAVIAPVAAEAVAASGIGTALAVAGGAVTVANTVQSVRRRDLWNNPISREEANYNLGFGVGTALGGAAAKPFAGAGTALG
ncbi:MAG: SpvB/TcaC N-terminal domain-containing protein, partial [Acidobacteriaceae bacterium]|nr:SpvB/TcaC N-terminal domain-containing protein [Acidobacteriaceae bacterium]